jgi:hypothetical protein
LKTANSYPILAQYIHWRPYLNHLFSALRTAGIPFLVLKGWALMPDLYPDPNEPRSMGDIDLLVQPRDFTSAVNLLHDLGYRPNSLHPRYGLDHGSSQLPPELSFGNDAQVSIDLHSHIYPAFWSQTAFPIDMDIVWQSAQPFTDWYGNELLRLSPELTFLHLLTHIQRHCPLDIQQHSYQDLIRLLDRYAPTLDWQQVNQLAEDWRLHSALYFIRRVCQSTSQTRFPSALKDDWLPGPIRSFLVNGILTPFWQRHSQRGHWLIRALMSLCLVDQPRQAIAVAWKVFFPPAEYRYHLHGYSITLAQHYNKLFKRLLALKR